MHSLKASNKIILVDNHPIIIQGLSSLFASLPTFEIIGHASTEQELKILLTELIPDTIILALKLPQTNLSRLIRNTRQSSPQTKIIVFSNYTSPYVIQNMKEEGISAYLTTSVSLNEIKETIIRVHQGDRFISSSNHGLDDAESHSKSEQLLYENTKQQVQLTERELDIVALLSQGATNKDMANELCLSKYTIETHRKNILKKLQVKTSAQLIYFASQNGLI